MNFYDEEGKLMLIEAWAKALDGPRHIRNTRVGYGQGRKRISTVWLGIDHNFGEIGSPIIFESMVFNKENFIDIACRRYSTKEEAVVGHAELVNHWKYNRRQRRVYANRKESSR